jgi:hypoxanthine phosphoribosyltransferase
MNTEVIETGERFFSKEELDKLLSRVVRDMCLDGFKPDAIAAISRGGLVPGVQLSHYFAAPLIVLTIDEHKHPRRDLGFLDFTSALRNGQPLLLVDEICDKGHTLRNIWTALYQQGISNSFIEDNLRSLVVVYNEGEKLFEPDYIGETINKYTDPSWIVFDWESWW